jgi:hypothetical protein
MNGLKVYLKSGTTKVYVYAQAVVGIFLIGNALREYEHLQGQLPQVMATITAGMLLMLGVMIPKRFRRNLRYVPGILIALGGASLLWLLKSSVLVVNTQYGPTMLYLSYAMIVFGLLQPIVDPRHYAFFTSKGIRYRGYAFRTTRVAWEEVKGIVYFDLGFELALKSGATYKMLPYNGESQNLRMHIDQMMYSGRQDAAEERVEGVEAPIVKRRAMADAR